MEVLALTSQKGGSGKRIQAGHIAVVADATGAGPIRCGLIALPFGPETEVDHVLCHLYGIDPHLVEEEAVPEPSRPPRDCTGVRRLFGH